MDQPPYFENFASTWSAYVVSESDVALVIVSDDLSTKQFFSFAVHDLTPM